MLKGKTEWPTLFEIADEVGYDPPKQQRIFLLKHEPTKEQLLYAVANFYYEFGLIRDKETKQWDLLTGDLDSVNFPPDMYLNADMAAHLHTYKDASYAFPSDLDLYSHFGITELILHQQQGIVQYTKIKKKPNTVKKWTPNSSFDVFKEQSRYYRTNFPMPETEKEHIEMSLATLKAMGVRIRITAWGKVDVERPLSRLKLM